MADCNLDHYTKGETFCYPSWCSMCERGPQRRRSISETNEPCRRKSKELKTLIPKKYNRSQEYENMEFEYECKGQWQEKDMRCEFTRIRSNLCELPTSYISNNCQISNSLTNPKLSNDLGSFDCMKGYSTYESPTKFVHVNGHSENSGDMQGKAKPETHKLTPNKLEVSRMQRKPELRSCVRNGYYSPKELVSRSDVLFNNYTMTKVKTEPNNTNCTEYCSLAGFRLHNLPGIKPVCYETSTYFNKRTDDASDFPHSHSREIKLLREQLISMKSTDGDNRYQFDSNCIISCPSMSSVKNVQMTHAALPNLPNQTSLNSVPNGQSKIKSSLELVDPNSEGAILPLPPTKSRNKISLKTRSKLGSAKFKLKPKSKSIQNVSTSSNSTESDFTGSDCENEINLDEVDNISEPSTDESNKDSSETALSITPPETGAGDSIYLLLRPSLFPNIPPYIRFNAHDYQGEIKFPYARKFFKWKLSTITPVIVRKTLTNSGFVLVRSESVKESNQWLGTWGKHMKSPLFKTLKDTQKFNHFPGTFQLGRKDRLWRNFQKMILKFGTKEFGFLPHTYILPQEVRILKQCWEYRNPGAGISDMWIIKPPASARGVGIKVINKWSQLPKKTSVVVQRYISNPYLINGSKFDLRLYVMVTSFHPLIIYLYPEGLARFASAKYSGDAKDLKDRYMHLTNYSINKLSSQYTANEDANSCLGHKWTISKLMEVLECQNVNTKALWKALQQLVIKTMIACEAPVVELCEENIMSRYNCYELFGIDVLLDENLKPWLLEVNISPSLHSASPLDAHVKGPLVQTLFDMALFHLPPKVGQHLGEKAPECFDPRVYVMALTKREKTKHTLYEQMETRQEYLDGILRNLTGDDIRQLTRAEDEFSVKGRFERIFPTAKTHKYLHFMEPRYYNRLLDAWEERYGHRREAGIAHLQHLCDQKQHLKVTVHTTLSRNSPNTIPSDTNSSLPKMEANLPLEEIMKQATIDNQISLSV